MRSLLAGYLIFSAILTFSVATITVTTGDLFPWISLQQIEEEIPGTFANFDLNLPLAAVVLPAKADSSVYCSFVLVSRMRSIQPACSSTAAVFPRNTSLSHSATCVPSKAIPRFLFSELASIAPFTACS